MSDANQPDPHDEWITWVERNQKRTLSAPERVLVVLLCDALRWGPWTVKGWHRLRTWGPGAAYTLNRDLSTYDNDSLTRLVIGAHNVCHRLSIEPAGPTHLRIMVHPRTRGGDLMHGHPTILQAVRNGPKTKE